MTSSYITDMVKNDKLPTKAHFFDLSVFISIIVFLAGLKVTCKANHIHKEADMEVLPFFAESVLASTLNRRTSAAFNIASAVASLYLAEPLRHKKMLLAYPELIIHVSKNIAKDEATGKIDSTIICYTQLTSMNSMRYADDLFAKSCKDADGSYEFSLNDIFIGKVDSSIGLSLIEYWAPNPQAELTDIIFKEQSVLKILKGSTIPPQTGIQNATAKNFCERS